MLPAILPAALAAAGPVAAATYTYTVIDVPGTSDTRAIVINDKHKVAGSYQTNNGSRLFTWEDGTIKTFEAPGSYRAQSIVPTAIGPTGLVAGIYGNTQHFPFMLGPRKNKVEKIGYPTDEDESEVIPTMVSHDTAGNVGGYEHTKNPNTQQHVIAGWETQPGEFVEIYVPGASSTTKTGFAYSKMHKYELTVGNFITDQQHGFFDDSTAPVDPPGSVKTDIEYLNDEIGQDGFVFGGNYTDASGTVSGFVLQEHYGRGKPKITVFQYPGAPYTVVVKSLKDGEVFGQFTTTAGLKQGFHYVGGQYYAVGPVAGAFSTLTGVSLDGSFTGAYQSADGTYHGYVATCAAGPGACTQ